MNRLDYGFNSLSLPFLFHLFFWVGAPTLPSYRKATSVWWLTSIGVPRVVGVTGYGHLAWASAPYPPEDKAFWATFSRRKTVIMLGLGRAPPMPRWSPGRSFRTGCPLSFLVSRQEPTGHTWAPSISCPNLWFLLFSRIFATRAFLFVTNFALYCFILNSSILDCWSEKRILFSVMYLKNQWGNFQGDSFITSYILWFKMSSFCMLILPRVLSGLKYVVLLLPTL